MSSSGTIMDDNTIICRYKLRENYVYFANYNFHKINVISGRKIAFLTSFENNFC